MTLRPLGLPIVLVSVLLGAGGAGAAPRRASPAQVKRGEYLVRVGGCGDCHTPMVFNKELGMPVPDATRMLSGHPEGAPDPASKLSPPDAGVIGPTFTSFRLAFGVVYAMNLTPDKDTGLGSWTEALFVKALRTGKHFGGDGRVILPPMPWPALAQMTDQDLKAVFAYLQTIPPIKNGVPAPKVTAEVLASIGRSYEKLAAVMHGGGPKPAAAAPIPAKPAPAAGVPTRPSAGAPVPAKPAAGW